MNEYTTTFIARCPANGVRIRYRLVIETADVIAVEAIEDTVHAIAEGYHEAIADLLHARLGGQQILTANHHGVAIKTTRNAS